MPTYSISYSHNGRDWQLFGENAHGSISKMLRYLYEIHTANFYRIAGKVYEVDHDRKSYAQAVATR